MPGELNDVGRISCGMCSIHLEEHYEKVSQDKQILGEDSNREPLECEMCSDNHYTNKFSQDAGWSLKNVFTTTLFKIHCSYSSSHAVLN